MVARSRARYLAPIALVAAGVGIYLVAHATLTAKHTTAHSQQARLKPSQRKFAKARFYTVQPGDSLTSIASKTGISLTKLEGLNPSADPNALQTGQRLRLRQ